MTSGRQTPQEEKIIPDYVTYAYLGKELMKWAIKNDFDLTKCDAVEELILLTLGVELDATPPLLCIFQEDSLDHLRLQFSVFFTNAHMLALGGLTAFQQRILGKLTDISPDLDPLLRVVNHSSRDTYGYDPHDMQALSLTINAREMLKSLLPAMQRKLVEKPALVEHYQRFNYSTDRVVATFKEQAELALADCQFEACIQQLANVVVHEKPGPKLETLIKEILTDKKQNFNDNTSFTVDEWTECMKFRLINRDATHESEIFKELLVEQSIPHTIDVMTAEGNELFSVVGMAILLQIQENLETRSILTSITDMIQSFPTALNPLIFDYLNLPAPTTKQPLLREGDAITFHLEPKKRQSSTNLPVTYFKVPASIKDKVTDLFNFYEAGAAKIVPEKQNAAQELSEEKHHENSTSFSKNPTVVVGNRCLADPSFLSDVRGMLSVFKTKAFANHRMPLDDVCSRFYLMGQRYTSSVHVLDDLYNHSARGRELVAHLVNTMDQLKRLSTNKTKQPLLWFNLSRVQRVKTEIAREEKELGISEAKPDMMPLIEAALARIGTYLSQLEVPLVEMEKQFSVKTLDELPRPYQTAIHYMLMLRENMLKCPIYKLGCRNGLRVEIDKTIYALESVMLFYIKKSTPFEHDDIDDDYKRSLFTNLQNNVGTMHHITEALEEILDKRPGIKTLDTEQEKEFFNDPDLYKNLKQWTDLFKKTFGLPNKILEIFSTNELDFDQGIFEEENVQQIMSP